MRDRLAAYKRLFSYLRPYPKQLILAYCGMLIAVIFQLFIPQLIRNAIDDSLAQADLIILLQLAGLILLVAAVRGLASFAQLYYSEWLTHQVSYDLRNDFYQAVQTLPFSFHDKAHTGDLMSRATSDINETERFIGIGSVDLLSTVILLVGVVVYIFFMNQELALLTLLPMLVLMLVAIRFGNTVRGLFKALQEQMGVVSKTMQESLTGIQLVKAFAREPHELSKFDHENNAWFEQRVQLITVWANNWPLMNYLVAVGILLLLWFGGPLALEGSITIGTLYAMINYMLILNGPVQGLVQTFPDEVLGDWYYVQPEGSLYAGWLWSARIAWE